MDKSFQIDITSACQAASIDTATGKSVLEAMVSEVTDIVRSLDSVAVPGFGTFDGSKTDERIVDDADSAKRVLMPPSVGISFNPSVVLRKKLTADSVTKSINPQN